MFPRISLSQFVLAGVALFAFDSARGQLASKSPFMSPQAAANAPTASAPLQFVGYLDTRDGRLFRIHDPARKASAWVKLNEKHPDFDVTVKQHDDGQKTLTVEHQGKTLTLAQREPKIVSSGSPAQAAPPPTITPAAPANVPPAVTQAVVLNPTPADEQRRLEAVAAEVARRRALREQATQQINQGQTPQVAVPTPNAQPQPPRVIPGVSRPANAQQR